LALFEAARTADQLTSATPPQRANAIELSLRASLLGGAHCFGAH
jgi:hypothetical protein